MKDKLLLHFQTNYCVIIGHPTDKSGPATNMQYFMVASKDLENIRGKSKDDDDWAKQVLEEIGEEFTKEKVRFVLQTSNEFIEKICGKRLGIHM